MLQLAPDTWESIICSAWDAVRDRVETKKWVFIIRKIFLDLEKS